MNETGLTFEQAYSELEETVRQLEEGGLPLEESLALFQKGTELSTLCGKKLDSAELRVRILLETAQGQLDAVPFDELGV
jgi:exodeoxyribonuclease VII small subunit